MQYVGLLRGINVGGHRKVPMAALRALLTNKGLGDVQTYIQSGNVVFSHAEDSTLGVQIQSWIKAHFDFDVPTVVLDGDRFRVIGAEHPFAAVAADQKFLHVTFLGEPPSVTLELPTDFDAPNTFVMGDQVVYLHHPGGSRSSKLTNNFFEKRLGIAATTRNWRTVGQLIKRLDR